MGGKGGHDTGYLKDTVGEALARGCAAAIQAQPNDPVEFLGLWLMKYVKNAETEGNFYKDREAELQGKANRLREEKAEMQKAKSQVEERKAAAEELAALSLEPLALLQAAVELIKELTDVSGAYAAFVADPEEPDWVPPEDDEAAAVESEDEADVPPAAEGEEGAEPPAEDEEPPAEGEEGGEPAPPKIRKPIDYSKKYFAYTCATTGQEFICDVDLFRPAPPPEDDEEAKPEPLPYTFRILDEKVPMLYLPNVTGEERMTFFRKFPKIGAYQACGIQLGSGEFKAIVAADTLFPEAGGQPMSAQDQDTIWEVSLSIGKALDNVLKAAAERISGSSAAEAISGLKARLAELVPPPPDPDAAPEGGADGEDAAEGAPEAEAEEAELEPEATEAGEEGEEGEGEEGEESWPRKKKVFDPVPGLKAAAAKAEKQLTKLQAAQDKAAVAEEKARAALELDGQRHATIVECSQALAEQALFTLRHTVNVPQATFHMVKAVLHLLGKDPSTFATWKRAYSYFTPSLFQEMAEYDATQERNMEVWKAVRSCYKAVTDPKKLETEMPDNQFGVIAMLYIKQVRRTARKAALHRAATAALEKAQEEVAQGTSKVEQAHAAVEEAERAKAEAEAAAAVEAEQAAARAAAEAEAQAAAAAQAEAMGAAEAEGDALPEGEEGFGEEA